MVILIYLLPLGFNTKLKKTLDILSDILSDI